MLVERNSILYIFSVNFEYIKYNIFSVMIFENRDLVEKN